MNSQDSDAVRVDINIIQESRIRGRVVLTSERHLFPHFDTIVESVRALLKRNGLQNVRPLDSGWTSFTGKKWTLKRLLSQRNRDLKDVVDQGAIKVYQEGSEIVASYYARTLKGMMKDLSAMAVLIIPIVVIYEFGPELAVIPSILAISGLYSLSERTIRIHWFMKRQMPRVIHTVKNLTDEALSKHDTSVVEIEHRELSPANLIRSAYYFRENSGPEKANAYLAYLVEKYPWSDEADMALEELWKQ
jgi:hypothetical protein